MIRCWFVRVQGFVMSSWYLIHTKIRQERVAQAHLERQGFECFLPLIQAEKLRRGALQVVQEPLFPRYLFIRLSADSQSQSWAPIRSTVGVCRLVSFGQTPAKVNDALVADLRKRADATEAVLPYFAPGDRVVVMDQPFAGLEAIYQMTDGEGRVTVLLNLLSKDVKMAMSPAGIRKVN